MAFNHHIVIFSRSCFDRGYFYEELIENVKMLKAEGFELHCTSHNREEVVRIIKEAGLEWQVGVLTRDEMVPQIEAWSSDGSVVIIVGVVNKDLVAATSTKSFLVGAGWARPNSLVVKYGMQAPTPTKMKAILKIITNQTVWFYECSFNDPIPTKILALCCANTYGWSVDPDEREVAKKFQAILKDGANQNPAIKQALMCHLMAAIAHNPEFKEVQDWAVAPSSSVGPNEVMEELKEHVRYMMNGEKRDYPIFVRHTTVTKSRNDKFSERQKPDYCLKHFGSIKVNENYRGKLKGRVVCVLDDYLTHGNMFETLRNILVKCGVKKVICVVIGKFLAGSETGYMQKQFDITGDVHSESYNAKLEYSKAHNNILVKQEAKQSVVDLIPLIQKLGIGGPQ